MRKSRYFLHGMLSVFSFPFFDMRLPKADEPDLEEPLDLTEEFKQFPRSDAEAIASDWKNVGNDIRRAITQYEEKFLPQV